MGEIRVSTMEEIKNAATAIVTLPPFSEGTIFNARLCRPSMMELMKSGQIPNQLIATANELFSGTKRNVENELDHAKEMFEIFDIFCKASLVEPTYEQLESSGITLTDEQKVFIFNYSQEGVRALSKFRKQQKNSGNNKNGGNVQPQAK